MVLASVHNNGLSSFFVLQNNDAVLKVKINSKHIFRQINSKKSLSCFRNVFPIYVLEKIEMFGEKCDGVHLGENCVESLLVLGLQ